MLNLEPENPSFTTPPSAGRIEGYINRQTYSASFIGIVKPELWAFSLAIDLTAQSVVSADFKESVRKDLFQNRSQFPLNNKKISDDQLLILLTL